MNNEEDIERLVSGLFGDGLTQGEIEVINNEDESIFSRDIDEIIDYNPALISLVTKEDEQVGFALLDKETPKLFPKPSITNKDLNIWIFEEAVNYSDEFLKELDYFLEIPVTNNQFNNLFYNKEDFKIQKNSQNNIDLNKSVTFAMAATAMRSDNAWKNVTGTIENFIELLLTHTEGKKDGQCFVQGEIAGNGRGAKSMIQNYFIGFDLDTGETAVEIDKKLSHTNLGYVRYTTHSHLKDITEVKRDSYLKWSGANASKNVDKNKLRQYLIEKKGFVPRVLAELEILEDAKVTEEGTTIIVKHCPMPKHRLMFFLKEPFVFQGKANQAEEIKAWKEYYNGFGTALGFIYDKSCTDPSRLFYLPRHEKGKEYDSFFKDGDYVDLRSYERITIKRDSINSEGNDFTSAAQSLGVKGDGLFVDGFNLKRWVVTHDCELIDLLEEYNPDVIKNPRSNGPGYHIECPFEDEHTKAGGLGTFAINSSDNDKGFHIHCTHDACQGRNKLDYIKKMVELEWFPVSALTDEKFCPALLLEEDEEETKANEDADSEETKANEDADSEEIVAALTAKITKKTTKDETIDILREIAKTGIELEEFNEIANRFKTEKRLSKKDIDKTYSKKLEKVKQAELTVQDDLVEETLRKWNEQFAMVDVGSISIMDKSKPWSDSPFTKLDTWRVYNGNQKIWVSDGKGGGKMESIAKMWEEWPQRKSYKGVIFDPRKGTETEKFNLFKGFKVKGRQGSWKLLQNHIYEILCNKDDHTYQWLITWMADIIQNPGEKKGSAIVLRGSKGAGKSIVFSFLAELLQPYAMTSSQPEHITGKFNWHFRDKLLVIAEEGLFAGDKRNDSIIKELVTGNKMLMEPKGIDPFNMEQFLRLVIISNEDWVINASADERRYLVLEAADKYAQDLDYFAAIEDQMRSGGLEAMMYDLENYDPPFDSGWSILRSPPKTEALSAQVSQSIPVWERFFITLIENYGTSDYELGPIELSHDETVDVSRDELRQHYYNSLRTSASKYHQTAEAFAELSNKYLAGVKLVKKKINGEVVMKIPPINDIRSHVENKLKIKLNMIELETE